MSAPLPERWADEPWPLDDPTPAPSLRPSNWSDTHADPPQVADLADEAWQYAMDHGVSMEVALTRLQERRFHTGGLMSPPQPTWTVSSLPAIVPKRWPDPDDQWIWDRKRVPKVASSVVREGVMECVGTPPAHYGDTIEVDGQDWEVVREEWTDEDGERVSTTLHLRAKGQP